MWMRGGTSKGGYFLADDLPADTAARDELLLRVMGSPDVKQIDGMVKDKSNSTSEDQGKAAKANIEDLTKSKIGEIDDSINKKVSEITTI